MVVHERTYARCILLQFMSEGANVLVCTPGRLEDILTGDKCDPVGAEAIKKGLKALASVETKFQMKKTVKSTV
jgi:hypothetical protein